MLLQLFYHIFMHPDDIPIPMWSIMNSLYIALPSFNRLS